MIKILVGNVGSGKTVSCVRDMYIKKDYKTIYSNIKTKLPNQIDLKSDMIVKKEIVKEIRKRDGSLEPVYDYKLNSEFWQNIKEPIDIILDEAHSIINARRSFSKINVIVTDYISLCRRILGEKDGSYGELVFITQLPKRIDVIAREMATQVRYHVCHYTKQCKKCGCYWSENSEQPEQLYQCPRCQKYQLRKMNFKIEVWKFANMEQYEFWRDFNYQSFYSHYFINDIEDYFKLYDTFQWDNMFSDLY